MNEDFPALEANATEVRKEIHRELRKKDDKGLFLIHQYVNPKIVKRIIEEETTKGTWDTLKNLYADDEKLKLKYLKKQYSNASKNRCGNRRIKRMFGMKLEDPHPSLEVHELRL